jgi:hypothetical protein
MLENPEKKLAPLVVVPAAIVYTNKSKYRSDVGVLFVFSKGLG